MADLDSTEALARDSLGLFDVLAASSVAVDEARAAAEGVDLIFPPDAVRSVAVCGMGGSAIAADLVAGAFGERLLKPVTVVRDYYLPGWVGPESLVILSSYSGTTEETLTCALEATERGALTVGITSGGKLGGAYADQGVPVVPVPGGLQPRAALLRLLVPLVVVLERTGVIPPAAGDLDEVRSVAEAAVAAYGPAVPTADNPAKQLARALDGSVVAVWGSGPTGPVARRWKAQINENAKLPATWSELPELDHNEIVGFAGMGPLGPMTRVVSLRDPRHHRQVARRFDLTKELIQRDVAGVLDVMAEGTSPLARSIDLVMLGDYLSMYMAVGRDVDPGPVDVIDRLKEMLASTPYGRTAPDGG